MSISAKLGANRLIGGCDVLERSIHQMQYRAAPLDMAEKAIAEPGAFMGAFD